MAKVEDVIVSDRPWRWTSVVPGNRSMRNEPFVIVGLRGIAALYCYLCGSGTFSRAIADIAAHADPDPLPKCEVGCIPKEPCGAAACPGRRPEYTYAHGFREWDYNQGWGKQSYAPSQSRIADAHEAECWRNEARELRCGRDLACGLFKVQ